ncbi:MAG: FAD binding domain-containing protein [Oscillospiraceae bacterium]|nr:FAD binding domain-containing protein [Oscillospiraceae bacterium]MCL2278115.1 FAD binding domain-containing protein [Oscillospiraceae bacterium]
MVKNLLPETLEDALTIYFGQPELVPYSGGTDIMVGSSCEDKNFLFINRIPELKQIRLDNEFIRFGSACTFTEVIENDLTPTILKEACKKIAAPAIRNVGTIGGNIANGSAKADSALIFMVTNSLLRLQAHGSERILPLRDFYIGRSKTAIKQGELISEILMPKQNLDNYYYEKVGARKALSISRVSFAAILDVSDDIIRNCATAFGAVSDVILRPSEIDNMLIGKSIKEAKAIKSTYIATLDKAIVPRSGRVSIEFRKDVCMNLISDFLESNGI